MLASIGTCLLLLFATAAIAASSSSSSSSEEIPQMSTDALTTTADSTLIIKDKQTKKLLTAEEDDVKCTDSEGTSGICVPPVACIKTLSVLEVEKVSPSTCSMASGEEGICCTQRKTGPTAYEALKMDILPNAEDTRFQNVADEELQEAWEYGVKSVDDRFKEERKMIDQGIIQLVDKESPAHAHHAFMRTRGAEIAHLEKEGLVSAEATRYLLRKMDEGSLQMKDPENSTSLDGPQTFQSSYCSSSVVSSRFRTPDGSCNNVNRWEWGKARTGAGRLLTPTYRDGISTPRTLSIYGRNLTSARKISTYTIYTYEWYQDPVSNLYLMQFGQFLDHDLTKTALTNTASAYASSIACCSSDGNITVPSPHQACFPIEIPGDDGFYYTHKQKCMEFVRSAFASRQSSDPSWSNQMNILTSWVDGSNIYGSDWWETYNLRTCYHGKLKTTENCGRSQLPRASSVSGECTSKTFTNKVACFTAGDDRVNEQPGLTLMHTIWLREHNRIAEDLMSRNPSWYDERIFQEARRLVIAEMNHIVYNEWLPLIVGPQFMDAYDLFPTRHGYVDNYNPNINPSISVEFSTAAFRFGHTLVHHTETAISRTGNWESIRLKEFFNDVSLFNRSDFVENFIRGFSQLPMQQFDNIVVEDLTNFLFKKGNAFGMDLIALNIQRGRDHGIPTYNQMRKACGLKTLGSWNDIYETNLNYYAYRFQYVYEHPDDIDLFVGGLFETSVPGGTVGHTFACIISDMFAKLKRADRHFYELGNQAGSFSLRQLNEIKRKTSFARILCDNSDIGEVAPLAFRMANNPWNLKTPCSSSKIPKIDLDFWIGY